MISYWSQTCLRHVLEFGIWQYEIKQDVIHFCVFDIIVYTYIFSDLYLLKPVLRTINLVLIGYFNIESYKLLDQKVGSIYNK